MSVYGVVLFRRPLSDAFSILSESGYDCKEMTSFSSYARVFSTDRPLDIRTRRRLEKEFITTEVKKEPTQKELEGFAKEYDAIQQGLEFWPLSRKWESGGQIVTGGIVLTFENEEKARIYAQNHGYKLEERLDEETMLSCLGGSFNYICGDYILLEPTPP